MKVPTLETSVGIQTPTVSPGQAPSVVPGAFGGQVAQATEGFGKAIGDVSAWAQRQAVLRSDELGQDSYNKFNKAATAAAYDQTPETVKDANGNDYTRPKGWMLWEGNAANGAAARANEVLGGLQDQYAPKSNPIAHKIYNKYADFNNASQFDSAVKYEAKQVHAGGIQTRLDTLSTLNDKATISASPDELKGNMQLIALNHDQNRNFDSNFFGDKRKEADLVSAARNSAEHTLMQTGDLDSAKKMLDSVSTMLPPDKVDDISQRLDRGYKFMTTVQQQQKSLQFYNNEAQVFEDMANGKLSWLNSDNIAAEAGRSIRPNVAKAVASVLQKGSFAGEPTNDDEEGFASVAKGMMSSTNKEQLHDQLIEVLKHNPSLKDLQILTKLAKEKGNTLVDSNTSDGNNVTPQQARTQGIINSILKDAPQQGLSAKHIIGDVLGGADYNTAMKAEVNRKYPETSTLEDTPHAIATPDGKFKYLNFNKNITVAPAFIHNSKSGQMEINTNRAKTSGNK
jgi:hypothetical protein